MSAEQAPAVPARPFVGLTPTVGTDGVRWAVESMSDREGVALVVPAGFAAYARVLHPLPKGRRWADVAPAYLQRGGGPYAYPFPKRVEGVEGNLDVEGVAALLGPLRDATSSPDVCHYGLWSGWGWLHPGSAATLRASIRPHTPAAWLRARRQTRQQRREQITSDAQIHGFVSRCAVVRWWGGRDMVLFDGPLDAVTAIGHQPTGWPQLLRQSPQWWWPDDRAWFVGTEIDHPWTYVGGSSQLVERLVSSADVEAVAVDHGDPW